VIAGVAGAVLAIFVVRQGELGWVVTGNGDRRAGAMDEPPLLIQGLDRDGDQRVSWREFHIFDRLDLNGDGLVDASEVRAERKTWRRQRQVEVDRRRARANLEDRNGDGRISAQEFPGSRASFQRRDRNRNGFIDSSERKVGNARPDRADGGTGAKNTPDWEPPGAAVEAAPRQEP